jgi:uncharacterized damage-inducible protein DinB
MKIKTINSFEALDYQRKELFRELDQLNPAALSFKTKDEEWSILQVLHHLYIAESGILQLLKKKVNAAPHELKLADAKTGWRKFMLNVAFAIPGLKIKAPSTLPIPREDIDYGQLKADWLALSHNYRSFLSETKKEYFDKEIFKHPRAGYLSMNQAFKFMSQHMHRHEKQIRRMEEAFAQAQKIAAN